MKRLLILLLGMVTFAHAMQKEKPTWTLQFIYPDETFYEFEDGKPVEIKISLRDMAILKESFDFIKAALTFEKVKKDRKIKLPVNPNHFESLASWLLKYKIDPNSAQAYLQKKSVETLFGILDIASKLQMKSPIIDMLINDIASVLTTEKKLPHVVKFLHSAQLQQKASALTPYVLQLQTAPPLGTMKILPSPEISKKLGDAMARSLPLRILKKLSTDDVRSVAFSPDGKLLAAVERNGTVRLWDVASWQEKQILTNHKESINSIAFSPDGKLFATGSEDGITKIWQVDSGQLKNTLHSETGVLSVAFSPDGTLLAAGLARNGAIQIWDMPMGTIKKTLKGHKYSVYSVAFSPDGKLFASGSDDQTIKIWDVASWQEKHLLEPRISIFSVAFSPDSKLLASGFSDYAIGIWNTTSGKLIRALPYKNPRQQKPKKTLLSVAFNSDGTLLAGNLSVANRFFNETMIWNVGSWQEKQILDQESNIAFSPDSKLLASGSRNYPLELWGWPENLSWEQVIAIIIWHKGIKESKAAMKKLLQDSLIKSILKNLPQKVKDQLKIVWY